MKRVLLLALVGLTYAYPSTVIGRSLHGNLGGEGTVTFTTPGGRRVTVSKEGTPESNQVEIRVEDPNLQKTVLIDTTRDENTLIRKIVEDTQVDEGDVQGKLWKKVQIFVQDGSLDSAISNALSHQLGEGLTTETLGPTTNYLTHITSLEQPRNILAQTAQLPQQFYTTPQVYQQLRQIQNQQRILKEQLVQGEQQGLEGDTVEVVQQLQRLQQQEEYLQEQLEQSARYNNPWAQYAYRKQTLLPIQQGIWGHENVVTPVQQIQQLKQIQQILQRRVQQARLSGQIEIVPQLQQQIEDLERQETVLQQISGRSGIYGQQPLQQIQQLKKQQWIVQTELQQARQQGQYEVVPQLEEQIQDLEEQEYALQQVTGHSGIYGQQPLQQIQQLKKQQWIVRTQLQQARQQGQYEVVPQLEQQIQDLEEQEYALQQIAGHSGIYGQQPLQQIQQLKKQQWIVRTQLQQARQQGQYEVVPQLEQQVHDLEEQEYALQQITGHSGIYGQQPLQQIQQLKKQQWIVRTQLQQARQQGQYEVVPQLEQQIQDLEEQEYALQQITAHSGIYGQQPLQQIQQLKKQQWIVRTQLQQARQQGQYEVVQQLEQQIQDLEEQEYALQQITGHSGIYGQQPLQQIQQLKKQQWIVQKQIQLATQQGQLDVVPQLQEVIQDLEAQENVLERLSGKYGTPGQQSLPQIQQLQQQQLLVLKQLQLARQQGQPGSIVRELELQIQDLGVQQYVVQQSTGELEILSQQSVQQLQQIQVLQQRQRTLQQQLQLTKKLEENEQVPQLEQQIVYLEKQQYVLQQVIGQQINIQQLLQINQLQQQVRVVQQHIQHARQEGIIGVIPQLQQQLQTIKEQLIVLEQQSIQQTPLHQEIQQVQQQKIIVQQQLQQARLQGRLEVIPQLVQHLEYLEEQQNVLQQQIVQEQHAILSKQIQQQIQILEQEQGIVLQQVQQSKQQGRNEVVPRLQQRLLNLEEKQNVLEQLYRQQITVRPFQQVQGIQNFQQVQRIQKLQQAIRSTQQQLRYVEQRIVGIPGVQSTVVVQQQRQQAWQLRQQLAQLQQLLQLTWSRQTQGISPLVNLQQPYSTGYGVSSVYQPRLVTVY